MRVRLGGVIAQNSAHHACTVHLRPQCKVPCKEGLRSSAVYVGDFPR